MKASNRLWELWQCRDEADAARRCADALVLLLRERLDTQTRVSLFLSGGKSPAAVFDLLAHAVLDWSRVDVFLVDERFALEQPADQNIGMVRQHLRHHEATHAHFHDVLTAPTLEGCVEQANALTAHIHQPDIVLLGMGLDGHTASLFPDSSDFATAMKSTQHYVAVHPAAAPHPRISMSFPWLSQARALLLFIPGADKWRAFQHFVVEEQGTSPLHPLLKTLGASATVIATGGESP